MNTPDTNTDTETETTAGRQYPTLGANAADLTPFEDVETENGDLLLYDVGNEDAWIQSDIHADRADLV